MSSVLAGWAAFFGWLVSELSIVRGGGGVLLQTVAVAALVGASIGSGVGWVAGLGEGMKRQAAIRAAFGLLGGFVCGAIGGLAGQLLYSAGQPRAVGWALMGLGIGATDGIVQRSARKTRNGTLGGAIGGFIGGLLFAPISTSLATGTGMASRATGFVIMGLAIGAMIGVVQVVLKEAWVTVVDGFRTGRQLILSRPVTVMGRAEHIPLPFLGNFGRPLEMEHAKILRQPNGRFLLVDNNTKTGTRLNNQPVEGSVVLSDGDVICIGSNYIRFNEQVKNRLARQKGAEATPASPRRTAKSRTAQVIDDDFFPFPVEPSPEPVPTPVDVPVILPETQDDQPVIVPPEISLQKVAISSAPKQAKTVEVSVAQGKASPSSPSTPKVVAAKSGTESNPVAPASPKPPAPSGVSKTKSKSKATPKPPLDPDACPHCKNGVKHPGTPGQRYCMVHDQLY